jgi:hypothetical protein
MNKIVALQMGFSHNPWISSEIANRNTDGQLMKL